MAYDLKSITAPRLAGTPLVAAANLLENPASGALLKGKLLRDAGIEGFRKAVLHEPPSVAPPLARPATLAASEPQPAPDLAALAGSAPEGKGFRFERIADFHRAYREGKATPEQVADRLLEALAKAEQGSPALKAITVYKADELRAAAKASAERHKQGQALGPLDGVPVAVKEELDVTGYATTAGTRFLRDIAKSDATTVARLRAAGALIFGKANMHEIGIDPSGFNAHHGTPRNPYDPSRYTGGSSSGSGAAVAAGLCPLALGADGGGSIRIPASFCGVVGLKATWSRISEAGAYPLCWSVGHVGPLGATARDVALGYALTAGPDPRDANTLSQPPVHLAGLGGGDLEGVRLGIYTPWFEHADGPVVAACRAVVKGLEGLGATVVEVELPDLELCRLAHGITILSEMGVATDPLYAEHRTDFSPEVRLKLALARELTARDYVRAQQVRTRSFRAFEAALAKCDAILTPSTAITAPVIADDVFPRGESNLDMTSGMMRYAFASNLTGHPAISFPAGYDPAGMPVGLQAIGRAWEESLLLRLAEAAEGVVERKGPKVGFRLLG